jgi:hypothetical protein
MLEPRFVKGYVLISGSNILNYTTSTTYNKLPPSILVKEHGELANNLDFDEVMKG